MLRYATIRILQEHTASTTLLHCFIFFAPGRLLASPSALRARGRRRPGAATDSPQEREISQEFLELLDFVCPNEGELQRLTKQPTGTRQRSEGG